MKKRILSIITTCLVIGVITFLSSYYILRPNISNLKELNNTKEFTKEEQNKLINVIWLYLLTKYLPCSSLKHSQNMLNEYVLIKFTIIFKTQNCFLCIIDHLNLW